MEESEIISKHPYMKNVLEQELNTVKTLVECLEKRITLVEIDYDSKSEYEKNEIKIRNMETSDQIRIKKALIKNKEQFFKNFMAQFIVDLKECNEKYESVVEQAQKKASSNKQIANLLDNVKWEVMKDENNVESKVEFYKKLRKELAR